MADKLGELLRAMELGKAKEGSSSASAGGLSGKLNAGRAAGVKHTWTKNTFGTVGSPRAKKIGRGKH